MSDQVAESLRQLGEKLGVGNDYLWPQLVAYQRALALMYFIAGLVWFGILIAARGVFAGWYAVWREDTKQANPDPDYVLLAQGTGLVFFLFGLIILSMVTFGAIPGLIAPEGAAIYEVLKAVKPK